MAHAETHPTPEDLETPAIRRLRAGLVAELTPDQGARLQQLLAAVDQ